MTPSKPLPIDNSREYRTRSGRRVVLHDYVEKNSAGAVVSFPVKGTIITSEKPRRTRYQIWSNEGRAQALGDSPDDLVDFPPVKTSKLPA